MSLVTNLGLVEARIAAACQRAGRPIDEVRLVAVSKLQPVDAVREAYAAGQRHFGENYAQELRDKASALTNLPGLQWHAIGPLQTNKAKYVAKTAFAFHALDRLEIAAELSRRRQGPPLRCLVEVNLGDESSKSGLHASEVEPFLASAQKLPNLQLTGLMCLPPLNDDPEASRPHFRALRALAQRLELSELSMGTTHDFEVAIEEGATMVRVGTAIFGARATAP